MKTKTKTLIGAALAAIAISVAPASAKGDLSAATEPTALPETYGGCGIGGYGGSYYRGGGHSYDRGYSRSGYTHSYRTRCRVVDRYYFHRGCYRYCRITYLHERVDSCGRVVSCWRSCKTVRA
jgi:hypothetical protein